MLKMVADSVGSKLKMNLIAAVSENMGIGKNNDLPWKLPKEFKYFQEKTTSTENPDKVNAVVMGRRCWESIPAKARPLKNRLNVVISKTLTEVPEGVVLCKSFEDVWHKLTSEPYATNVETVWNVGGSEIYSMGLSSDHFHRLYLTRVCGVFDCDVFFPEINFANLRKINLPDVPDAIQEENNIKYAFEVYERI